MVCKISFCINRIKINRKHFYNVDFNTNLFPGCVKVMRHFASAVNVLTIILVLVVHYGLRYLFSYYQNAQMNSYELQK